MLLGGVAELYVVIFPRAEWTFKIGLPGVEFQPFIVSTVHKNPNTHGVLCEQQLRFNTIIL